MKHLILAALFSAFCVVSCGEADSKNQPENESESNLEVSENTGLDTIVESERDPWQQELIENVNLYVQAILNNEVEFLASNTHYPILRTSPLPGWENQDDFRREFYTTFDDSLRLKLENYMEDQEIIDLTGSKGQVGILNGQLWFTDQGELIAINYESKEESEKREILVNDERNAIHPIIKNFEYTIYIGSTEDYIFRIDQTEEGLRYAQWSSTFTMADEPDFILRDGQSEAMGSSGGWRTTFDKVDTKYILDQVAMCENPEDCGDFLIIEDEGEVTEKWAVTRVTNPFDLLP